MLVENGWGIFYWKSLNYTGGIVYIPYTLIAMVFEHLRKLACFCSMGLEICTLENSGSCTTAAGVRSFKLGLKSGPPNGLFIFGLIASVICDLGFFEFGFELFSSEGNKPILVGGIVFGCTAFTQTFD